MVGSPFVLLNRNGRKTILNVIEIAYAYPEDVVLAELKNKVLYRDYDPAQGTLYTIQLSLTSRRDMELVYATTADRVEMYEKLIAVMSPGIVLESSAPRVRTRAQAAEANPNEKLYSKNEVFATMSDIRQAVVEVLEQEQMKQALDSKPPRKPYTRKPRE